jgi:hypothetical protein
MSKKLAATLLVALGLIPFEARSEPRVYCPPPTEGRTATITMEARNSSGEVLAIGSELALVCVNSDGETEVRGEALVIRVVPEPSRSVLLGVGLVALAWLKGRSR